MWCESERELLTGVDVMNLNGAFATFAPLAAIPALVID